MAAEEKQQICICGGGNGAHVFAVMAASLPNKTVNVLSLYADEHQRWKDAAMPNGTTADFVQTQTPVTAMPDLITNNPAEAIPGSDVIIICIPAFAHEQYLRAIAENATKSAVIGVFPGYGGVEFQFKGIFGDRFREFALLSSENLPWACRLTEYGKSVQVLGTKHEVGVCVMKNKDVFGEDRDPIAMVQECVGDLPTLKDNGHVLGSTFSCINALVHPQIMYAFWGKEWDGQPLDQKPLFYQGISEDGANFLERFSDEVQGIAEAIRAARPGIDLRTTGLYDWYVTAYGKDCDDTSSLFGIMRTNPSYNGLTHPCVETEDGKYLPDYNYRYMKEDIPFGVSVFKGLAELVGMEVPLINELMMYAQTQMGKQYLAEDGTLSGKDLGETRAPQAFGFRTLDDAVE